jgi:hypothetical protein
MGGGLAKGTGAARVGGAPAVDVEKTTGASANTPAPKDKPERHEFVVLLFWNEDVPSDKLMSFVTPDPTASTGAGGAGAGGGTGLPGKGAGK